MRKALKLLLLIGMVVMWFDAAATVGLGATEEWIEVGQCTISHYCHCARCNGRAGQPTSSGTMPERFRTVAVDPKVIPMGSRIYIEGYGYRVAEDTGVRGNWVDVFTDSHQHALDLGLKKRTVWIVKEVEE